MTRAKVRLNNAGIRSLLKSGPMLLTVKKAADDVAENVRDMGIQVGDRDGGPREVDLPVTVRVGTTDRAHASVTLAHPAGRAVQAKHGALTKAAARAGLKVRGG